MQKAALLDMYNGEANRGIPMLRNLLGRYADALTFDHFDVRAKGELPSLDYDIYVFSGGPGNPLENDFPAFDAYFQLIEKLWDWNNRSDGTPPKHCLFICHSFQMACHHFGIGEISPREHMSFGTYPVFKTAAGKAETLFAGLPDPFYIADFRRFQVLHPDAGRLNNMGAQVLCLETLSPGVPHERAVMAVRFSPWMFGTQFHPEADPEGMFEHFKQDERREQVVTEHGEARYFHMIRDLANPQKIGRTFATIVPSFLNHAIAAAAN